MQQEKHSNRIWPFLKLNFLRTAEEVRLAILRLRGRPIKKGCHRG